MAVALCTSPDVADGVTISPTDWEGEAESTEGDVAFRGVDIFPEGFVERLLLPCVILAMESVGRVGFCCSFIKTFIAGPRQESSSLLTRVGK